MKVYTTLLALLINAAVFSQTTWIVDKGHSKIRFTATHMLIAEVSGVFNDFEGKIVSNNEDFGDAEVSFTAKVGSLNSDNERRDGHLKSDDFFNVEKFPELKVNGKINKEGDKYYLVGEMTIRDVIKPIKFDVKYNGQIDGRRGRKAGFKVTGMINRFDYDMKFSGALEAGGLIVSDEIEITVTSELNEQAEASDN
jgi:polyisoprenoid-binding protein YceI